MRIGILILSMGGGGAERVVSYLLSYCVAHKIKAHLILMNPIIQYAIPKEIEIHYLEKHKLDEKSIIKALKIPILAFKYARLVKKLELTHSLSFLTRPSLINIISSKISTHKYKIIVNERSYPSLQYGNGDFRSIFNRFMISRLFKFSDLVIANSIASSRDLINNFSVPEKKMKVIHNPIDSNTIKEIKPLIYFFDSNSFNLITVGRLNEGKNHELLIKALKKLNNPLIKIYIFGEGHLADDLENLILKYGMEGQVFLMGFTTNPYQYLKAADLFVFSSNFEGFPNVLLEAMACGLPILSTNCNSGPNEIMELKEVKHNLMHTEYGLLVPINDLDLMSKGIDYMYRNKDYLKQCQVNCLIRVRNFEKEKILQAYLDSVQSI